MITTVGLIGLGKMGFGLARRLRGGGVDVIATDRDAGLVAHAREELGIRSAASIAEVVDVLPVRSVIWLMLPAGEITRGVVREVAGYLTGGHVVVDGGNSNFADAPSNAAVVEAAGGVFVDVGVSGGQWGWQEGYGLMVGASPDVYEELRAVLDALAGPGNHHRVGACGAGHLAKSIHNGVQYAVMQSYAEGYALLEAHDGVDTVSTMSAWQSGSSVRSWLLEQMLHTLAGNPTLDGVSPVVPDSGMGRWTAGQAIALGVPTPVLTAALYARFHSQVPEAAEKLLRASRAQIGGQR